MPKDLPAGEGLLPDNNQDAAPFTFARPYIRRDRGPDQKSAPIETRAISIPDDRRDAMSGWSGAGPEADDDLPPEIDGPTDAIGALTTAASVERGGLSRTPGSEIVLFSPVEATNDVLGRHQEILRTRRKSGNEPETTDIALALMHSLLTHQRQGSDQVRPPGNEAAAEHREQQVGLARSLGPEATLVAVRDDIKVFQQLVRDEIRQPTGLWAEIEAAKVFRPALNDKIARYENDFNTSGTHRLFRAMRPQPDEIRLLGWPEQNSPELAEVLRGQGNLHQQLQIHLGQARRQPHLIHDPESSAAKSMRAVRRQIIKFDNEFHEATGQHSPHTADRLLRRAAILNAFEEKTAGMTRLPDASDAVTSALKDIAVYELAPPEEIPLWRGLYGATKIGIKGMEDLRGNEALEGVIEEWMLHQNPHFTVDQFDAAIDGRSGPVTYNQLMRQVRLTAVRWVVTTNLPEVSGSGKKRPRGQAAANQLLADATRRVAGMFQGNERALEIQEARGGEDMGNVMPFADDEFIRIGHQGVKELLQAATRDQSAAVASTGGYQDPQAAAYRAGLRRREEALQDPDLAVYSSDLHAEDAVIGRAEMYPRDAVLVVSGERNVDKHQGLLHVILAAHGVKDIDCIGSTSPARDPSFVREMKQRFDANVRFLRNGLLPGRQWSLIISEGHAARGNLNPDNIEASLLDHIRPGYSAVLPFTKDGVALSVLLAVAPEIALELAPELKQQRLPSKYQGTFDVDLEYAHGVVPVETDRDEALRLAVTGNEQIKTVIIHRRVDENTAGHLGDSFKSNMDQVSEHFRNSRRR